VPAARLPEVILHLFDLARIAPVWTGFDGHNVAVSIALEIKVDTFGRRLSPTKRLLANVNGQSFEKIAENGFFLRRQVSIEQLFDERPRGFYMLCLEKIGILANKNALKL